MNEERNFVSASNEQPELNFKEMRLGADSSPVRDSFVPLAEDPV